MGLFAGWILATATSFSQADRPNVVLIITDDQGYGDLGAHGNPVLQTPNLDDLYQRSVRLTNFHVDPTCSPTRAALMSGRYSTKTGVWHTIAGRSLMATDEVTIAERFRATGYRTGMFGKWHLGDGFPLRPQDQGFQHAFYHGGGGVGQTPDAWGNDYFDDRYWLNGHLRSCQGYCTDVWFEHAIRFMGDGKSDDRPFFVYLSTNAPHGPYRVPESYRTPYRGVGGPTDRFFGMIANIDENLGRLIDHLQETDQWNNTLLVFMTDNGTAQGEAIFNAGMRGKKGSQYEGGHRVPCFWHWPAGGIGGDEGGRDVDLLTAHIDMLPTLADLCTLDPLPGPAIDGHSLRPLLTGSTKRPAGLVHRTLFVHSQRILHPEKWRKSAVMKGAWRLIDGQQLFDLQADPAQRNDVAKQHPMVVARLRKAYDGWWQSLQPAVQRTVHYQVGHPAAPELRLTAHDWLSERVPWNQSMIRRGPNQNGPWAVQIVQAGRYEIVLSRWPLAEERPIEAKRAELSIQGQTRHVSLDPDKATVAQFEVLLEKGQTRLQGTLTRPDGSTRGPYYASIRLLP